MSRVCAVCSKGPMAGNQVSHSNRKTRTVQGVNVQKKRIAIEGKEQTAYVCTKCLKTAKRG
jgi:large subunit ribosomal protein L28